MNYSEQILGYDAREMYDYDFKEMYNIENGHIGLLKSDIVKPITVDQDLWYSLPQAVNEQFDDWVGANYNTWPDLHQLEAFISTKRHLFAFPFWTIAISRFVPEFEAIEGSPKLCECEPNHPMPHWQFVGFDIADMYFEGILVGSQFKASESDRDKIVELAKYLNEYHLFTNIEAASEYLHYVPTTEWKPIIYGIYKIKEYK